jgi:hypothetical protein
MARNNPFPDADPFGEDREGDMIPSLVARPLEHKLTRFDHNLLASWRANAGHSILTVLEEARKMMAEVDRLAARPHPLEIG